MTSPAMRRADGTQEHETMLQSVLFANDPLLEQIAADQNNQRISTTQNRQHPAVRKVQEALLIWDPNCLPNFGADGDYGSETAGAVHRFKVDVLLVPEAAVIDDVGPLTVQRLDQIAFAREQMAARRAFLDALLSPALSGVFSAVHSGDIFVHPSGAEAFAALNTALATCVDDRALVVLAGWGFQENTELVPGTTIRGALEGAASRGAKVRALWNHFPTLHVPGVGDFALPNTGNNARPVQMIREIPGGAAIHDARVLHHTFESLLIPNPLGLPPLQLGVHHQKLWVVWNGDQLIAFAGGIDIDPSRIGPAAWHDVQIQVHGEPAFDIYNVLRLRWEEHPDRPADVSLPQLIPSVETGSQRARVVTTFGNPNAFAGLNGPPYGFAPGGSKAIRQMISHLISRSQRYIYVEDQYFVDEQFGIELAAAMPHLQALIVLFADTPHISAEIFQAFARRRKVFEHLAPFRDKLAVAVRKDRFVHSKLWIFDDEVAIVGSANANRRGYEHDSEIAVAYGDLRPENAVRSLRERLWAQHLGPHAPAPGGNAVDSLALWKQPPADTLIATYDWTVGTDHTPVPFPFSIWMTNDIFWNIVDPACP